MLVALNSDEHYVCITSSRHADEIMFYHEGGVEVGDVDDKAERLLVPLGSDSSIRSISPSKTSCLQINLMVSLGTWA